MVGINFEAKITHTLVIYYVPVRTGRGNQVSGKVASRAALGSLIPIAMHPGWKGTPISGDPGPNGGASASSIHHDADEVDPFRGNGPKNAWWLCKNASIISLRDQPFRLLCAALLYA